MKHLNAAILASSFALSCQPSQFQDPARPKSAQNNPCADFALDAERVWSKRDTRALKLGTGGAEIVTESKVIERVRTKMDNITRDWVMAKESACKDALVRKVTPVHVYNKIAACLDSALIKQRTAVGVITSKTVDISDAHEVFDDITTQLDLCRNEAIYSFYGVPEGIGNADLAAQAEKTSDDATVLLRMSQIDEIEKEAGLTRKAGEASNNARFQVEAAVVEANKFRIATKFKEAAEAAKRALLLAKKSNYKFGQANALEALGVIERELAEYDQSLSSSQEAMTIKEEILGKEHPVTAQSYYHIGLTYNKLKDHDRALKWLQKAKEIQEKKLQEDDINTAQTYNALGHLYAVTNKYNLSIKWNKKALGIKEKVLGTMHPITADSYNKMGILSLYMDNPDEAIEWFEKYLGIDRDLKQDEDPSYAAVMNNMSKAYYLKKDYKSALRFIQKSISVGEKALGNNHPNVAKSYDGAGNIYKEMGELKKALKWYEKAIKVKESRLGHEHVDTLDSYKAAAQAHNKMKNFSKALVLYKKVLKAQEKTLGVDHEATITSYMSTGIILYNDDKNEEALAYFNRALEAAEAKLGSDHKLTKQAKDGIERVKKDIDWLKREKVDAAKD